MSLTNEQIKKIDLIDGLNEKISELQNMRDEIIMELQGSLDFRDYQEFEVFWYEYHQAQKKNHS